MKSEFARRLRQLRKRTGISQEALAGLCGMNRKSIDRYERGETTPSLENAEILARFFGVSLDWLCGTKK